MKSGVGHRWLVAAALLVGACGPGASPTDAAEDVTIREAAPTSAGTWQDIPKAPVGSSQPGGAFWIDSELVVVAGPSIAAWNSDSREWRVLADIPQSEQCEGCGYGAVTVWSGEEILLWGGGFSYRAPSGAAAGAAYNSTTDELRALPDAPIELRGWHSAVWTGDEMIVWGGACGRSECTDGAAYDPTSDSWRQIADAPMVGYGHSTVWTGEEMIVWGGSDDHEAEGTHGFPRSFLSTGAAYDPGADSWRELATAPLDPRGWHSAIWTGEEMIVWGGVKAPCNSYPCESLAADAGAYNPATDSWREIDPGPLVGRVDHSAVWADGEMIVWGGSSPGGGPGAGYSDGGTFDPRSGEWTELPEAPIGARYRHQAIWANGAMFIWGGFADSAFSDGASFNPHS